MPEKSRVLLVEGRDDREVIYQFCNYHQIDNKRLFCVIAVGSVEELIQGLSARIKSSRRPQVLGILVDADTNLENRWAQICSALSDDYHLPEVPSRVGTILEAPSASRPKIGIWVMPDNQAPGILEDFLLHLTNENDSLARRAKSAVQDIPDRERLFGETKFSKAVIHTWLAWQKEPGTALGQAFTRRYLDPDRNSALEFKAWLETLFA
ncbi:MAG: DUF3226 domain-containing protein [Geitlerinemataceae cyanobacterium]